MGGVFFTRVGQPAAIMKTKKAGGGDGDSGAGGKKGAVGFLSSLFGSGE